jgi:hypothetical protein
MAVAFFATVASLVWSATVAWIHWLRHRFDDDPAVRAQLDGLAADDRSRLQRLESAVDALGIELERVGEAQRFTVRLLDERLPAALPSGRAARQPESGRVITPH